MMMLILPPKCIFTLKGGALLGKVLSQFYKSVEKLGFVAGGEFKAAVEEG
jgi:hypothetical protein